MHANHPSVAVIGSGPSGCYAAQFLRKTWPGSEIIIIEALPVPYGLVRYGVASDHQGTKAIIQQFDRLFERDGVRFAGNVTVGRDISFEQIREAFDVVVLATGLDRDRELNLQNDVECPVVGAGSLLKALNGHPNIDIPRLPDGGAMPLGERIAVVGNGNVAMDVIRILCKRHEDFTGSDIADDRLSAIRTDAIKRIDVIGRSPPAQTKFDLAMLKEIVALEHVRINATGLDSAEGDSVSALLSDARRNVARNVDDPSRKSVEVTFHFSAKPEAIRSVDGVNCLLVRRSASPEPLELKVDRVIAAIGFMAADDALADRCSGANVFRVGWLNSGGKGAIAANRRDAKEVVELICSKFTSGELRAKSRGFDAIANYIGHLAVPFQGWRRIDDRERCDAAQGRCRRKILSVSEMIAVAGS